MRLRVYLPVLIIITAVSLGLVFNKLPLTLTADVYQPISSINAAANPDPSSDTGRIAYTSQINDNGRLAIFIMNADGSNQTQLTFNPASEFAPALSFDSRRIAFTSTRDGQDEIYTMHANGSHQTRLTTQGGDTAAWSHQGDRIAFPSHRDGNAEIYVMNSDGSHQIRLTNTAASESHPNWSPDDRKIAYSLTNKDGSEEIWAMNSDGTGQARITANGGSGPVWSPDGTRIAFTLGANIWVMDADGSNQRQLTNKIVFNFFPTWSPDGKRIAYGWFGSGLHIVIMDADGSNETVISSAYNKDSSPSWSKGRWIAPAVVTGDYRSVTTNTAVVSGKLVATGSARRVTVSFEYGTSTQYGNSISAVPARLSSDRTFTALLQGLAPNTLYHYRVKAEGNGTAYGQDVSFTTAKPAS